MFQIRHGIFETNSSSVHTLILCEKDDYDKWLEGELLLNIHYKDSWYWGDKDVPQFVTEEQAAYYDSDFPYIKEESNWGEIEFKNATGEWLNPRFLTYEDFEKCYEEEFYTFSQEYLTPKGEEVLAFGYYGYEG